MNENLIPPYRTEDFRRIFHRKCQGCTMYYFSRRFDKTFWCPACQHERHNPRDAQLKGKNWFGWIRESKFAKYKRLFGKFPEVSF